MADEEKEKPVKAKKGGAIKTIGIGLIAGLFIGGGVTFFLKGSDPPPSLAKGEKVAEVKTAAAEDDLDADLDADLEAEMDDEIDEEEAAPDEGEEGAPAKKKDIVIFDLDPFVVNLADTPDVRYLKVTIKLDLLKEQYVEQVTKRIAQIRDTLLILLSSKEFEAVRTVEGKMELRDEILQRVNSLFRRRKVRNAYFTDFVTQ
ncbi:MAG: flagellar basal body-associated protein FliL [Nitrospiria bacterium]